jgi:hypothetical protein
MEMKEILKSFDGKLAHHGTNENVREIRSGDMVYIITIMNGELYLGGRIEVDKILNQKDAERYINWPFILWKSDHHIVMPPEKARKFTPNNIVLREDVERLRFLPGNKKLVYVEGKLPQQILRTHRNLSSLSSKILDNYLSS